MQFEPTAIPEVVLIRPKVFGDERGFFMESWEQRKFAAAGLDLTFVQDNHSHSGRHILRGLHYQIKQPQGKLVRVVSGRVFDVAVDIRRSSPTFGRISTTSGIAVGSNCISAVLSIHRAGTSRSRSWRAAVPAAPAARRR